MATSRSVRFRTHDQFLKFSRLYFQRQAVRAALEGAVAQMRQQLAAIDQELAAVAQYEGVPLDAPLRLDAATATVAWDGPARPTASRGAA
jgi:hypothetical protein